MPASRTLAGGLALAALVTLSGCERPAPGVSVYSGRTTLRSQAFCWADQGTPAPQDCRTERINRRELPVEPGAVISIDVDEPVQDGGWVPAINSQALVPEPLRDSHYRFTLPEEVLRGNPELEIFATDRVGGPARGIWAFQLRHR